MQKLALFGGSLIVPALLAVLSFSSSAHAQNPALILAAPSAAGNSPERIRCAISPLRADGGLFSTAAYGVFGMNEQRVVLLARAPHLRAARSAADDLVRSGHCSTLRFCDRGPSTVPALIYCLLKTMN